MVTDVPTRFRTRSALALCALLTVLLLIVPADSHAGCDGAKALPGEASISTLRSATLCLINRRRARHGLRRLRSDAELRAAAQRHSEQMAARDFFSHVSPGGADIVDRLKAAGFITARASWHVGENIGWGSGAGATPAGMVRAWMNSAGHRANILRGSFRRIGIGIAAGAPVPADGPAATYTTDFGG